MRDRPANPARATSGGLLKDDEEAAHLYKLAADQGIADAKHRLGSMYEDGRGGLPNDSQVPVSPLTQFDGAL